MKSRRQLYMVGLASAIVLTLLLLIVVVLPPVIVDHTLGSSTGEALQATERLKAENDVRSTLLQALAGIFFVFTAYFTWRQIQNSQGQLTIAQEQLTMSREQQINERFGKAVEYLSSAKVDVALGGVYLLEEIAASSPHYRASISQILSAFVRTRSPWPPAEGSKYPADYPPDGVPDLALRDAAVQGALTVMGRQRGYSAEPWRYDIGGADLRAASLAGGDFSDSYLRGASLRGADLSSADLGGANLRGADPRCANLTHAKLSGADLSDADLSGAYLTGAQLSAPAAPSTGVVVVGLRRRRECAAMLDGAVLAKAHFGPRVDSRLPGGLAGVGLLGGANVSGVDFRNANGLDTAHFAGALDDGTAQWPADFNPAVAGLANDLAGVESAQRAALPPRGR